MAEKKGTKKVKSKAAKTAKTTVESAEVQASSITINAPEVIVSGGIMKDKVVPFLVALVVIGAFAIGLLYGQLKVVKEGLVAGVVTGEEQVQVQDDTLPTEPGIEEPVVLTEELLDEITMDPAYAVGEDSATVTLVEFTDYQCPFCSRYSLDTMGQIMEEYVDTGKVKYLMRDLPLSFHPNAKPAAIAARCAGDQGKYLEMHDKIFETQEDWSNSSDPREDFVAMAGEVGLDGDAFSSCYDGGEYDVVVDDDLALATKVGATGTPTFYINGTQIVGAQPFAAFQQAIDEALEQ